MPLICQVTGKRTVTGHHRSHAMNATKRTFNINIQKKRFWISQKKCFVTLRVSSKGIRIINKKGIESVLKKIK